MKPIITTVSQAFEGRNANYGRALITEGEFKGQSVTARYADGSYQVVDITSPKTVMHCTGKKVHPKKTVMLHENTAVELSGYEYEA